MWRFRRSVRALRNITWVKVNGKLLLLLLLLLSRFSCVRPTLCDPIDGSPPGSPVPGILQARVLEWGAITFSTMENYNSLIQAALLMAQLLRE